MIPSNKRRLQEIREAQQELRFINRNQDVLFLLELIDLQERARDLYMIMNLHQEIICPQCKIVDGEKIILHHNFKEHHIKWTCRNCGHVWFWKHPYYERLKQSRNNV